MGKQVKIKLKKKSWLVHKYSNGVDVIRCGLRQYRVRVDGVTYPYLFDRICVPKRNGCQSIQQFLDSLWKDHLWNP